MKMYGFEDGQFVIAYQDKILYEHRVKMNGNPLDYIFTTSNADIKRCLKKIGIKDLDPDKFTRMDYKEFTSKYPEYFI